MTTASPQPSVADTFGAGTQQRCPVCEHDLPGHDSVNLRYCRATQSRALTRDCICHSWS